MKLKNVTTVEKHFEKFLIGVTLAILAVVVYFYVLNPTTVKIDGQDLEPQQIDAKIYEKAKNLKDALGSEDLPAELKNLTVTQYMKAFSDKYNERLIPEDQVKVPFNQIAIFPEGLIGEQRKKPFFNLDIPAPEIVAQRADLGNIDPQEVQNNADLAAILPENAPFDTAWVSVVGRFDMATMVKNLTQPENDEFLAIPFEYGKFGILDVQMERQEFDKEKQAWSAPKMVEPMPGAITFRYLPANVAAKDALKYLEVMNKFQQSLVRPPFYLTTPKPWQAPEFEDDKPIGDRKDDLKDKIRKKRLQVDQTQKQIEKAKIPGPGPGAGPAAGGPALPPGGLPTPGVRTPKPPAASALPPGGPAVEPAPGGRHPLRPVATPHSNTARERVIEILTNKLTKLQTELRDLETEYQKLTGETLTPAPGSAPAPGTVPPGIGPGGVGNPGPGAFQPGGIPPGGPPGVNPGGFGRFPGTPDAVGGPVAPGAKDDHLLDNLGGAHVDLWVNDLFVAAGKTYRYRLRVVLTNPLYLKADAKSNKHYNNFTMASQWTEWGKPVTIERMRHFFIANAAPNGQARVDVWRFYQGAWLNHEFPVRAGDPVGGPINMKLVPGEDTPVDFFSGAYVVDMDLLTTPPLKVGDPPKKTTRVLFMVDGELTSRRLDLDKTDPKIKELKDSRSLMPATTPGAPGAPTAAAGN